jgi:hypothetical protein
MLKKHIFILISFFTPLMISGNEINGDELKTKAAAFLFSVKGEIKEELDILGERIKAQLTISRPYWGVINNNWLNGQLSNAGIKKGSMFNNEQIIDIGKMIEADIVIHCIIEPTDTGHNASIRGIDINTGETLFTTNERVIDKIDIERLEMEQQAKEQKAEEIERVQVAREQYEKYRLEREQLAKEADKKPATQDIKVEDSKFTKTEQKFIDTFYNKTWKFTLDDRNKSVLKYRQSIGVGIGLAVFGGLLISGGVASMVVLLNLEETIDVETRGENESGETGTWYHKERVDYQTSAFIIGGSLISGGVLFLSLSAIPFWFSYMVAKIYKKETGERLAFFERVNFNIGFAEWGKVGLCMSVKI